LTPWIAPWHHTAVVVRAYAVGRFFGRAALEKSLNCVGFRTKCVSPSRIEIDAGVQGDDAIACHCKKRGIAALLIKKFGLYFMFNSSVFLHSAAQQIGKPFL